MINKPKRLQEKSGKDDEGTPWATARKKEEEKKELKKKLSRTDLQEIGFLSKPERYSVNNTGVK